MILVSAWISACAPVGPDFVRPDSASNTSWSDFVREDFHFAPQDSVEWWGIFGDPVLNQLVAAGQQNNNNIRLAGLAVLEARATLGIARGSRYSIACDQVSCVQKWAAAVGELVRSALCERACGY